jgi:hypothetical protein
MNNRTCRAISIIAILIGTTTAIVATRSTGRPIEAALTVHEWGTFTSIAGTDGSAVRWCTLDSPSDLPCFVARDRFNTKRSAGTVRMETPVLYFYAQDNITVQVKVRFRQGFITEWFPPATVAVRNPGTPSFEGTIAWKDVNVRPGLGIEFPVERGTSHYYTARQTDASPLQSGSITERFLFYRGVGDFAPPISATIAGDGTVTVWSPQDQVIGDVILFENRGGAIASQVRHANSATLTLDLPAPDPESRDLKRDLVRILTDNGLYSREAEAMVDTWSDSWFEEGTRLFYIVPAPAVEAILPLRIDPVPSGITRVFVGRLELVTAATQQAVGQALATGDWPTLKKYGRFLQGIGERILTDAMPAERAIIEAHLAAASSRFATAWSVCN